MSLCGVPLFSQLIITILSIRSVDVCIDNMRAFINYFSAVPLFSWLLSRVSFDS